MPAKWRYDHQVKQLSRLDRYHSRHPSPDSTICRLVVTSYGENGLVMGDPGDGHFEAAVQTTRFFI